MHPYYFVAKEKDNNHEKLSFNENDINHDVVLFWGLPTKHDLSAINKHWMEKHRPLFFIANEQNQYLYNTKFKHPELGDYCIFSI
jgi:hypothetical protein